MNHRNLALKPSIITLLGSFTIMENNGLNSFYINYENEGKQYPTYFARHGIKWKIIDIEFPENLLTFASINLWGTGKTKLIGSNNTGLTSSLHTQITFISRDMQQTHLTATKSSDEAERELATPPIEPFYSITNLHPKHIQSRQTAHPLKNNIVVTTFAYGTHATRIHANISRF